MSGSSTQGSSVRTVLDPTERTVATGVLVLSAFLTVLIAVSGVATIVSAVAYSRGRDIGDLTYYVAGAVSLLTLLVALVLWVVTGLWLDGQRRRLEAAGHRFAWGAVATYVGWVVPLVNLVLPYRIVREVHLTAVAAPHRARLWEWWGLWVAAGLTDLVAAGLFVAQDFGDPARAIVVLTVVGSALRFAALGHWARLVRSTTTGHGLCPGTARTSRSRTGSSP